VAIPLDDRFQSLFFNSSVRVISGDVRITKELSILIKIFNDNLIDVQLVDNFMKFFQIMQN
jgi:hypothetical protein